MTHAKDDSAISMALEQIIENGLEGLDTAVSILINEAMRIERSRVLEADPWQRTETRKGYANGTAGPQMDRWFKYRCHLQFYIPNIRIIWVGDQRGLNGRIACLRCIDPPLALSGASSEQNDR